MDDLSHASESEFPASRLSGHPLPETLAEAEILAARIERAVWHETGGRVRDLHVEVSRRGVTLRGCCNSFYTSSRRNMPRWLCPAAASLAIRSKSPECAGSPGRSGTAGRPRSTKPRSGE